MGKLLWNSNYSLCQKSEIRCVMRYIFENRTYHLRKYVKSANAWEWRIMRGCQVMYVLFYRLACLIQNVRARYGNKWMSLIAKQKELSAKQRVFGNAKAHIFFIPNMQGRLYTCAHSRDSASVTRGIATSYEEGTLHGGSIWTWQHSTCAAKAGTVATYGGLRTLVLCCNMKQHPKNECMMLADDRGCYLSLLGGKDSLELCTCSNSMELIHFWEADSFSASQEFSSILRNPKVPYRVYKFLSTCLYPEPD
jgi:hypothetical protein